MMVPYKIVHYSYRTKGQIKGLWVEVIQVLVLGVIYHSVDVGGMV